MPSSSFIVNSEFQPMSYQELLHPVITQTQYQRELEEKYTQLDLQADKLEQLANSAVDQESYAKYKAYADRLREQASNLSKYGLRGKDNARFMELFRQYGKDIQPLLDAQAKRERLIAMQQQLSMQDPTSLYDRSAGNISLQELMANPSAAPVRQSGELLRAQAQAMAINLQNELRTAVIEKSQSPGYLMFKQKYGLSSNEIAAFVANPNSPQGNKVLRAIYNQVLDASGVKENWEGDAYKQATNYITMGLWSAIGKEAVQPLTDVWALQKDQQAFQERMAEKQMANQRRMAREARAAAQAARAGNGISAKVVGGLSPEQRDKRRNEFNRWEKAGYIGKNSKGQYYFTKKGQDALFKKASMEIPKYQGAMGTIPSSRQRDTGNNPFRNWAERNGLFQGAYRDRDGKVKIKKETFDGNLNKWYTNNEMGYDLNYKGKVKQNWGAASQGLLNDALASMSPSDIKKAGLSEKDFRNIQQGKLRFTLTDGDGITMRVQGKDGKYYNVPITQNIDNALYNTVINGAKQAININSTLRKIERDGIDYLPIFDEAGNISGYDRRRKATKQDIDDFVTYHKGQLDQNLIPQLYMNQTTLYAPISGKETKLDPSLGLYYQYSDPYTDLINDEAEGAW